jgi:predicted ATP-binding protein involved in virulence
MKINSIALANFRSFKSLEMTFERDITVIIANNGVGKSSILDAIALLFGRFLTRLPGVQGVGLSSADLRIVKGEKLAEAQRIWAEFDASTELKHLTSPFRPEISPVFQASRSKARDQSSLTKLNFLEKYPAPGKTGTKELDKLADSLVSAEAANQPYLVPLFAYYGTDRAVFNTPLRRRNFRNIFPRFDSMNGALHSASNFRRVFQWFHSREMEEAFEQRKRRSFSYADPDLAIVKRAIGNMFPHFKNPRTLLRPLRFVVDVLGNEEEEITLSLDQLSDGYRTMLALTIDLACRMLEANPPSAMKDPLKTEAIVMIDEVDLHLHPQWQQTIMPSLIKVFSKAQFIITTHSPQVLTTIEARCIRMLRNESGKSVIEIPNFSLGARSSVVLEDLQHVASRPPLPIVHKFNRYKELIQKDLWDSVEGKKLRGELDAWSKNNETEFAKIDIDIKLREMRRKNR